ncbi:MAG: alanine racemase [Spirochaetota bacterium]|jgi:alanine racemase|nr:alanine racemase [Spirochaetota bacterium]
MEDGGTRCWTEISLSALEKNVRTIKKAIAPASIYAVIKADAYGHGMPEMAAILARNGITTFCVATLEEAIALRLAGYQNETILFLTSFYTDELPAFWQYNITPVISDFEHLKLVEKYCSRKGLTIDVHLKIDTGMSRFGFYPDEVIMQSSKIIHASGVQISAICSHLAASGNPGDQGTVQQLTAFQQFCDYLEINAIWYGKRHILNSGGILYYRDKVQDAARPGLILYGIYPGAVDPGALPLAPALSFFTRVQAVKKVKAGSSVGYEHAYRAKEDMTLALLSAGYADGYPVRFSNKGEVLIGRERCPIVGRVCMDTTLAMVPSGRVHAGDMVRLWGGKELPIETAAASAGTIPYELTCQITRRTARRYVK